MNTNPAPAPEPVALPREHVDAAVAEEQARLQAFMQQQQASYLIDRCIELNARARAAEADADLLPDQNSEGA